ncbi:unnamed protein product [Phyllotreta striolata]|uniref:Uncharacterized protein n=1 Tax=Phyllotreta striolata TaxID=444603 RepID=A0A9N9TXS7_PHYSR|nr:unnamed protein product [Phyllotreta striolata]
MYWSTSTREEESTFFEVPPEKQRIRNGWLPRSTNLPACLPSGHHIPSRLNAQGVRPALPAQMLPARVSPSVSPSVLSAQVLPAKVLPAILLPRGMWSQVLLRTLQSLPAQTVLCTVLWTVRSHDSSMPHSLSLMFGS